MFKKIQKDRRGLTFVELICAIAILSIITGTVGGAMVVATDSYRRGTVETSLQQEAQFTANSIESLIVDVTQSVTWDNATNTLKIMNENNDYYEITYDSAAQELRYTEYVAGVATGDTNVLLADHVSGFTVNASNFDVTRNVILSISMQNGRSTYTTNYNVTSRNNPNMGNSSLVESATIVCQDEIVLEPNQEYTLPISISGSSTGFTGAFQESTHSTVSNQSDGCVLKIASDQVSDLTLRIVTTGVDGDGNPLAFKNVSVKIRRVNEISEVTQVGNVTGAAAAKKDAVYTVSVPNSNIIGSHLDQYVGWPTDVDYVNPYKIKWEICPEAASYVEFVNNDWGALHADTIQFKLKEDIPVGTMNVVKAVALHPNGKENNAAGTPYDTNKTGQVYGSVYKTFQIRVAATGSADFARGKLSRLYPYGQKLAKDVVIDSIGNHTPMTVWGSTWEICKQGDKYIRIDDMRHMSVFFRFKSNDAGAEDKSVGYDSGVWYKAGDNGGNLSGTPMFFKFRQKDFLEPDHYAYFMRSYEVEVVTGIYYGYYELKTNDDGTLFLDEWNHVPATEGGMKYKWYPEELNTLLGNTNPDTLNGFEPTAATEGVFTYNMSPMMFNFDKVSNNSGELNLSAYLSDDGDGLGTQSHPIVIDRSDGGSNWTFHFEAFGSNVVSSDAPTASGGHYGIESLINQEAVVVDCNNASNTFTGMLEYEANGMCNADQDEFVNDAKFKLRNLSSLSSGTTYKIVFNRFYGKGWEQYNPDGTAGKGEIYFKVIN